MALWRPGETTSCLAAFRKDTVDKENVTMAKGERERNCTTSLSRQKGRGCGAAMQGLALARGIEKEEKQFSGADAPSYPHVLIVPPTHRHGAPGPTHTTITSCGHTDTHRATLRPTHGGGSGSDTHGHPVGHIDRHTRPQRPEGHSLLLAAQLLLLVHQVLLERGQQLHTHVHLARELGRPLLQLLLLAPQPRALLPRRLQLGRLAL